MGITSTMEIDGTTYKAELATIESTTLGIEAHGFMTGWVHLDISDGAFQGFGGLVLGVQDEGAPTFLTEMWIRGILRVTGATTWEKLSGVTVYALRKDWGKIEGLASKDGNKVFMLSEIADAADKRWDALSATRSARTSVQSLDTVIADLESSLRGARDVQVRLKEELRGVDAADS